jgi:type IX secretion system PorP/SprF family membrane protein
MTGNFQGTVRIGGIYREQYRSVMQTGKWRYTTPSVYVDAPIMRGFRRKDWVAVGGMLFSDKAGESRLTQNAFKIAAAYHLALDKKATTVLTIGGHYGSESRSLSRDALYRFEDELLSGQQNSPDRAGLLPNGVTDDPKKSYNDIDAGVLLTGKLNKQMGYNLGFSMYHIGRPEYSLITAGGTVPNPNPTPTTSSTRRPRRTVIHGQFNVDMNKQWTFNPTFLFQTMSGADEIMLQAITGYKLNPQKDITLNMGIGYRMRDAMSLILGMKKKDLTVGLAYDINTSSLNVASNYRGGWELAANYIIRIYKPAVVKPMIICPRY